jgi:hypothetical protein
VIGQTLRNWFAELRPALAAERRSMLRRQAGSIPAVAPQSGNFAEAVVRVATSRLQKRRTRKLKEKMDRVEWDKCEPQRTRRTKPSQKPKRIVYEAMHRSQRTFREAT